jgi:hypothetical protein
MAKIRVVTLGRDEDHLGVRAVVRLFAKAVVGPGVAAGSATIHIAHGAAIPMEAEDQRIGVFVVVAGRNSQHEAAK